jgi:hypothetical protein
MPQVIEAARQGLISHGVELNPCLVLYSKVRARRLGLFRTATFARQDLWKANLGTFNNVVIFGVEEMVASERFASRAMFKGGSFCRCPSWRGNWSAS